MVSDNVESLLNVKINKETTTSIKIINDDDYDDDDGDDDNDYDNDNGACGRYFIWTLFQLLRAQYTFICN